MPAVTKNPSALSPPQARTPLAQWHAQHGARFDEIESWQVPVVYSSEDRELEAARTGLALADVSFVAKMMLRGPGVADVTPSLTEDILIAKSGRVAPLKADKSVLVCRLHIDQLLLLAGPSGKIRLDQLLSKVGKAPTLLQSDVTSAFAAFWLFGPFTDEALRQSTHHDISAMPPGSCAETGLAGVPAILVRSHAPAITSMRILTGWDVAEYVWEKIWQVGETWKISPMGMDALDLMLNQGAKH
jgi:glycine cleavage system aminomethyltransferase T